VLQHRKYKSEVKPKPMTDPVQLDGREVEAKRAVSREESNKPGIHKSVKRLFMGGVKENITEPDVKAYFSS